MIIRYLFSSRAIPVIVMGVAFFLSGCQQKTLPPAKVEITKEIGKDVLALAASQREQGKFAQALESYRSYLGQKPESKKIPFVLTQMAEIYLENGQYHKGLNVLEKISKGYPDYSELPLIDYNLVQTLHRMGDYQRTIDEAVELLHFFR